MNSKINKDLTSFLTGKQPDQDTIKETDRGLNPDMAFSFLFFSDVRKNVSDKEKYNFTRQLVEFADQSGFEAVYFPERHFNEFGSVYANNSIMAAYFAPITKNVRLRTAAVTITLHHPVEIVENWSMIDILSEGRVDLGFGNGWNKQDFILSPDTYENRVDLRNERIPMVQKLWRGDAIDFVGPNKEIYSIKAFPKPIQPELDVWYVTQSKSGFEYAGKMGYNIFTMLFGIDLEALEEKITAYRLAREEAGLEPQEGKVTLMMHTFVHPDADFIQSVIEKPFKEYIKSSLTPHMKAAGKMLSNDEITKMVEYSYARYFNTGGIFGSRADCQKQIDKAASIGVNEIAFLQDFGIDYDAVINAMDSLEQLVKDNIGIRN
jgi:natural product biosynthesis luciferase-like monooxygenase protein